jgi:hypothetical protein
MSRLRWLILSSICALICFPAAAQDDQQDQQGQPQQQEAQIPTYLLTGIKLPINQFALYDFARFEGMSEVPLWQLMSNNKIVLITSTDFNVVSFEHLQKKFGLKKDRDIANRITLFTLASPLDPETMTQLLNALVSDVYVGSSITAASPVFAFSDGTAYANGKLVVQWGSNLDEKLRLVMLGRMGLKEESFDSKKSVTLASTSQTSGLNTFRLSSIFGPQKGNAYVLSVEPQLARISVPFAMTYRVFPGDGKGYGGDIVGARFMFLLEMHYSKKIAIKMNELKPASDTLKKWLPKKKQGDKPGPEVSAQVFSLESDDASQPRDEGGGMFVTEIKYFFRMSQAGSFLLAPPLVHYSRYDRQLKKDVEDKFEAVVPAEFIVARVMPLDAEMVNDPAGLPDIAPVNPYSDGSRLRFLENALFWIALAAMFWSVIFAVFAWKRSRTKPQLSGREKARQFWAESVPAVVANLPEDPSRFWQSFAQCVRTALGLYVKNDPKHFEAMVPAEIAAQCDCFGDREALEEMLNAAFEGAYVKPGATQLTKERGEELAAKVAALLAG